MAIRVDDEVRRQIVSHYRTHSEAYDDIWADLETIHGRFRAANTEGKVAYLKLSYINSVMSVQTPVADQEDALTRLMDGEDLETALDTVNYRRQKQKYIKQSLHTVGVWEDIVSSLGEGAVDRAHKTALDRLNYIGPIKAPFILANLGYTEKMCFDTNVVNFAGLDEYPSTTDVQEYEELCQRLRDEFPVLREELDPFHLHWVIFDWQRSFGEGFERLPERDSKTPSVTSHDAWFNAALSDIHKIVALIESLG